MRPTDVHLLVQAVVERLEAAVPAASGVTRDDQRHMGNGLWGLDRIVTANEGRLGVKSGDTLLLRTPDRDSVVSDLFVLDEGRPGTSIDLQLR